MIRTGWFIQMAGVLFCLSVSFADISADDTKENPRAEKLALGFDLNEFHSDFGMGLSITSPWFAKGYMAVRAHGNAAIHEGLPQNETEFNSMPYQSARLGMVISVGKPGNYTRFYSEAGMIALFPSKEFSDDAGFGGYGLFGFEFFTRDKSPVTYFIQAGGVGSSGNADKLQGKPGWGNGFLTEVGIRWYP